LQDFLIIQKIKDMIVYGNLCLNQYPKHEKHVLAAEIRKSMYSLLKLTITANKRYYKKTTIQELDVELDTLRTFLQVSADPSLKYLSMKKYENWSKMLNEIGRMIGGWIKSINK